MSVTGGMMLQKLYFILIALVFVISIIFAVVIWRQTVKVEKKALAAKRAKEEYLKQLQLEREEEERIAEERRLQEQREIEEQQTEEQNIAENQPPDHETDADTNLK